MPSSPFGVKPLRRPLPTLAEFNFPETQPLELPRQPSIDSTTGSAQPPSDSPADPRHPSSPKEQTVSLGRRHPRTDWSPNAAWAFPTRTPDFFVGRGRPHFFVGRGPWTKVRLGE
ncbi:unnamed protein product [Dicrocoelium dendriticum]|nr:unnamed protein product [Dicrocoelium dendriticum]